MGLLTERKMLDDQWLKAMSEGRWVKTYQGYAAPRESVFLPSATEAEAASTLTNLHVIDDKFYGGKFHSFVDELKLLGVKTESEVYILATESLSFPDNPLSVTSDCGLFILNCLRNLEPTTTSLVEKVQNFPWLKTNFGFKWPSVTVLYEPDWDCLMKIVKVSIIDEAFYGSEIRAYLDELKTVGVATEFGNVLKIVVDELKALLPSSEAPKHLIALLNCIAEIKKTMPSLLDDMNKCLSEEEIIKTRHGYKKPGESILFNSKWASISQFVDLPIIDDSYYGIKIYGFRNELKMLGVLSSLEEGAIFVARGLSGPIERGFLTAESTLSLLDCLKILLPDVNDHTCPSIFLDNMMRTELLMTSSGYRLPKDSVLYQSAWKEMLELTDAPFIDDKFYGTDLSAYASHLKVIGVKVDPMEVCSVLSLSLPSLAETTPIKRIYGFLKEFQWKPNSSNSHIWIPAQEAPHEGQWVDSCRCVLYDKERYFAPILYSLDMYYENELLPFFGSALGVIEFPTASHFLHLWSLWETRESNQLSDTECCFFWGCILKNWNSEMEDILKKKLAKVPAMSPDGSILLVTKEDVFVADDLWLKNMFMDLADFPLFVWFPKSSAFSVVSPAKLCEVYYALGVRKVSDSVKYSVTITQTSDQRNNVDLKKKLIVEGLLEIVLGVLACKIHAPVKVRQEAAKSLLSVSVIENNENIHVCYQLFINADRCLEREAIKLVHWDKKSQQLFIDTGFSDNMKASAEFVNFFAVEVAEALLPQERPAIVNDLRNLIQMGFLLEFEERSVHFLLTRDNIEVSVEDKEFLDVACLLADGLHPSAIAERTNSQQKLLGPVTPVTSQRVKRRRLNKIVAAEEEGQLKRTSTEGDGKVSSKKKVAAEKDTPKDSIKRKKPVSAFFIFMEEFREQYKLEHSGSNSAIIVSKSGSEVWRAMSDLEKVPYIEMTQKRKAEYKEESEVHNTKMAKGRRTCVKEESRSDVSDTEMNDSK